MAQLYQCTHKGVIFVLQMQDLPERLDYLAALEGDLIDTIDIECLPKLKENIDAAKERVTTITAQDMLYSSDETTKIDAFEPKNILNYILAYTVTKTKINIEVPAIVASLLSSDEISSYSDEFEYVRNLYAVAVSRKNTFHNTKYLLKVLRYYLPFTNELAFTSYCSTMINPMTRSNMNPMTRSNKEEPLKLMIDYRMRYLKLCIAIKYSDFDALATKLSDYYDKLKDWKSNSKTNILSMDMDGLPFNIAKYCIDEQIVKASNDMKWELVKINGINSTKLYIDVGNCLTWCEKYAGRADKLDYASKRRALRELPITASRKTVDEDVSRNIQSATNTSSLNDAIDKLNNIVMQLTSTDTISDALEKVLTIQNRESSTEIVKNIQNLTDASATEQVSEYTKFSKNTSGYYKLRYFITGRNCSFIVPIINGKLNVFDIDINTKELPNIYLPDGCQSSDYMDLIKAQFESTTNYVQLEESNRSMQLKANYQEFFNKNNRSLYHTLAIVVKRTFIDCNTIHFYQIVPSIFFDEFVRTVRADIKCIESPIYPYALVRWTKRVKNSDPVNYHKMQVPIDSNYNKFFAPVYGNHFSKVGLYNIALDYIDVNSVTDSINKDIEYEALKNAFEKVLTSTIDNDNFPAYIQKFKYNFMSDPDLSTYLLTLNNNNKEVLVNGSTKKIFSPTRVLGTAMVEKLNNDVYFQHNDEADPDKLVDELTKYSEDNKFYFYEHEIIIPSSNYNRTTTIADSYVPFKPKAAVTSVKANNPTSSVTIVTKDGTRTLSNQTQVVSTCPLRNPTTSANKVAVVRANKQPITINGQEANKQERVKIETFELYNGAHVTQQKNRYEHNATRISLYNDEVSIRNVYLKSAIDTRIYINTLSNIFVTRRNLYVIVEDNRCPIVKLDIVCGDYVLEVCIYDYLVLANAYHKPVVNTSILFTRLYNDMNFVITSDRKLLDKLDILWKMFDLSRLVFKRNIIGVFNKFGLKTITFERVARYISYNLDNCLSYNFVHAYLLYKFLNQNNMIDINKTYNIKYTLEFDPTEMYTNVYLNDKAKRLKAMPYFVATQKDKVSDDVILERCKADTLMYSLYYNLVNNNTNIGPEMNTSVPFNELFNEFGIHDNDYVMLMIACTLVNEYKVPDTEFEKRKLEYMLMLYNKMCSSRIITQRSFTELAK